MKLPLPVVIVFIGIVALLALVALRPKTSSSVIANNYTSGYTPEARVIVNGQAIDLASQTQSQPLSWLPAAAINANQVYAIERHKGKTRLVFVDGSIKELTDFDIANLPNQLKLQVTYEASK